MPQIIRHLNTEQKLAVTATQGPVLVLAGPGTGKTQLLCARCAGMIKEGKAAAENILILTYTNSAAKEMKERLVQVAGQAGYGVEVCTFHSFANSILLESEEAADYVKDRVQIQDVEKIKALEFILDNLEGINEIRPFGNPYLYRKNIEDDISKLKKEDISPEKFERFIETYAPDGIFVTDKHLPRLAALAKVYKMYENIKDGKVKGMFQDRGRYDYDDMVMLAVKALENEKDLREKYRAQYRYVMVDEFQDTNKAQLDLLFLLAGEASPNVCCVGDDDQSIFRFQGATISNFNELRRRFPGLKVISLKDNYRSTKQVLGVAGKIISQLPLKERMGEKLLVPRSGHKDRNVEFSQFATEEEELLYIVNKVKELKKRQPYDQMAVLVRKRDQILKIIDAFLLAGIPYATDGKEDISGEKRVRQMLDAALLACSDRPDIDSDPSLILYKVLNADYLRISQSDILRLVNIHRAERNKARAKNSVSRAGEDSPTFLGRFIRQFPAAGEIAPTINDTQRLAIVKAVKFDDASAIHRASWAVQRLIRGALDTPAHNLFFKYIKDVDLYNFILKKYDTDKVLRVRELRALTSFLNMVKDLDLSRPGIGLLEFVDEMRTMKTHGIPLQGNLVTQTQEGVRALTAHGSKGLEFDTVFIPFCLQDKNWPSKEKTDILPLPQGLLSAPRRAADKKGLDALHYYDETRLFYVASSRARSDLFFTASPGEDQVKSSYLDKLGVKMGRPTGKEEAILADFLKKIQPQDQFAGTRSVLKDMVSKISLSPTSINNYLSCKRKFLYDNVLMLPGEKKEHLVFGNCVHKALEQVYAEFGKTGKFPDAAFFRKAFTSDLRLQGIDKKMHKHCLDRFEGIIPWFKKVSRDPVRPIGLEKKIAIMLGDDLIVTGNYDKLEVEDEKKRLARVVDYKTGKPDEHLKGLAGTFDLSDPDCEDYLRQLVCYKMLFERDKDRAAGQKISHGVLVFLEPAKADRVRDKVKKGDYINKKIELTDGMVMQLEKLIQAIWKAIKRLDFQKLPKRDAKLCKNCDFDDICWK